MFTDAFDRKLINKTAQGLCHVGYFLFYVLFLSFLSAKPSVVILDPFNIRLGGQRPTLHFDDLQPFPAVEILKTVNCPLRNVGALIFAKDQDIPAIHDLGLASHNNPMLAPVPVPLQAQAFTREHFDKLYLKIFTVVDHGVITPWPPDPFFMHKKSCSFQERHCFSYKSNDQATIEVTRSNSHRFS